MHMSSVEWWFKRSLKKDVFVPNHVKKNFVHNYVSNVAGKCSKEEIKYAAHKKTVDVSAILRLIHDQMKWNVDRPFIYSALKIFQQILYVESLPI